MLRQRGLGRTQLVGSSQASPNFSNSGQGFTQLSRLLLHGSHFPVEGRGCLHCSSAASDQ